MVTKKGQSKRIRKPPLKKQPEKAHKLTDDQKLIVKNIIARGRIRKATLQTIQGFIIDEIDIRLSLPVIHGYLTQVEEEWRAKYLGDTNVIKAAELAKLDHLEDEVYSQWERSKLDAKSVSVKAVTIEPGDKKDSGNGKGKKKFIGNSLDDSDPRYPEEFKLETERTEKTSEQCGDSRYIHNLMEISERRAKLLGIDAPTKVNLSGSVSNIPATDLTDEQIAAELSGIQSQRSSDKTKGA
jgi:hypothetical protein